MKRTLTRVCIYPKDVQCLTGKSLRHSRDYLKKIRLELGKPKDALLTIDEFCLYSGISLDTVLRVLVN